MGNLYATLEKDYIFKILSYRTPVTFHKLMDLKLRKSNIYLTKQQWSVLAILWENDGCTQNFIAEKIYKDKPGVTRLVDNLQRAGYVKRKLSEKDRRQRLVHLTPKSKAMKNKVVDILDETIKIATKDISEKKLIKFMEIFDTIFNNIERHSKEL